jgi:hypothetical protein
MIELHQFEPVKLHFVRNDRWSLVVQQLQADKTPVDLTGAAAVMTIRTKNGTAVLTATTENGRIVITPTEGRIDIAIPRTVTDINVDIYDWMLRLKLPNDNWQTIAGGELKVLSDVN